MKKYPLLALIISIAVYFLSSFAFPVLSERIVVPVMIICILVGIASIIWLIVVLIKQRKKK
ncbi:MAG: hypothetical protein WCP73_10035 [Eubacteriales bacterium]